MSKNDALVQVVLELKEGRVSFFRVLHPQGEIWAAYRKSIRGLRRIKKGLRIGDGDMIIVRRKR